MAKKKAETTAPILGRPPERNRGEIAVRMLEWATKDDSINLSGFCCSLNPPLAPSKLVLYSNENDSFREAYEITKAFIAHRREKMLNCELLHVKAYDLNAAVYDYFLKQERRDQLDYEAKLKTQTEDKVDPAAVEKMTTFFEAVHKASSARNNPDSNNNKAA